MNAAIDHNAVVMIATIAVAALVVVIAMNPVATTSASRVATNHAMKQCVMKPGAKPVPNHHAATNRVVMIAHRATRVMMLNAVSNKHSDNVSNRNVAANKTHNVLPHPSQRHL
jgi:hypothetical protein